MSRLWYGADEVNDFHPVVEECISRALTNSGLQDKYYAKHHFGLHTNGIPDFVLLDKQTDDYVCIIEVKKTPLDTLGQEAGFQTRNYIKELYPLRWKVGFKPNFCVTNVEYTQFYGLRENTSLIGCLLENSPKISDSIDSSSLKDKFTDILSEYFQYIDSKADHKFSMHLETISESFNHSFFSVAQILGANFRRISNFVNANESLRRGVLYELFRFAFYYYLKEFYLLNNNELADYFADFETSNMNTEEIVEQINSNFDKVLEVDFANLVGNYLTDEPVFPNKLLANEELGRIFINFIQTLNHNASEGITKNSSLLNYVSLITSDIYNKEEMHSTGKIMSDEILSEILANFTIESSSDTVFDPCCGDGNLLTSAYHRKKQLGESEGSSHNKLLSEITGIDIDPNLIQLSAFKLIGQDLNSVNNDTYTNLKSVDFINDDDEMLYDSVVMNPPYLRNEDLNQSDKDRWLISIEKSIGKKSLIRDVSQPNQYYYFIEKAVSKVSENGTGAFILMSKFLNNKDGKPLKEYLVPYLDAVIHYPPSFFKGFAVTTDIFIIKKPHNVKGRVSFMNVKDTSLLGDVEKIKWLINTKNNVTESEKFSLVNINRTELNSDSNWRLYLIDPENKFKKFEEINDMTPITSLFSKVIRGKAGNSGGSAMIFPESGNNNLSHLVDLIEPEFIGYGLLRNNISNGRRKFRLTKDCLVDSKGLHIKKNELTLLMTQPNTGVGAYLREMKDVLGEIKFNSVMNQAGDSLIIPDIIIPRGDRNKHSVFYYPENSGSVLLSTNFFALSNIKVLGQHDKDDIKMFITAFLLSSFGQLQFEIHGNSQEGSRKIEKRNIELFRVPNPKTISADNLRSVNTSFINLDNQNIDFVGTEQNNLRDELDDSIANMLFNKNDLGFNSASELKSYFQKFLAELVNDRNNK